MNVEFFEKINERLKSERQRLLMTQVEMAEKCGVTPTTYSNYELGKRKPDAKFLQGFAEIGGDIGFLFTGSHNKVLLKGYEEVAMVAFHSLTSEQKVEAISYMTALAQGLIKGGYGELLKNSNGLNEIHQTANGTGNNQQVFSGDVGEVVGIRK
ncbi:helix-turn-helix transcriptional regulator [Glaesserella parasuis]|nr:helix-turn-helix transcriptional regulator [Glaesserella parasuis]MDE3975322.1 helix-turn-helix transcriptional regulator [Glaesserella parasuis]